MARTFRFEHGTGPLVEGPGLVSPVPFSARYDLDRATGVIARGGHPLRGASVASTIFVAPGVQGGVAAGWALLAMKGAGVAPAALVFGATNPVMVQGAVLAGITVLAGVEPDFFELVRGGELLRADGYARTVEVVA